MIRKRNKLGQTRMLNKESISVLEAAKELNYCTESIRFHLRNKSLLGFKHANKWWIYVESVQVLKARQGKK